MYLAVVWIAAGSIERKLIAEAWVDHTAIPEAYVAGCGVRVRPFVEPVYGRTLGYGYGLRLVLEIYHHHGPGGGRTGGCLCCRGCARNCGCYGRGWAARSGV